MNHVNYLLALVSVALLTACSSTPTLEETTSSEFAGLNRATGTGFGEAWVRPGAALSDYRVIDPTALRSADATIVQPNQSAYSRTGRKDVRMTAELGTALAEAWDASIRRAASDKGLEIAADGDKVLRVDAALTRIAPSANFAEENASPGRSTVYTEDSGSASIEFRLYDARSGELLAVVRDKRRVGSQHWSRANSVTAAADVRNLFNQWANRLVVRITDG